MKQVVNYITIEDLIAEYKILENYINRTYGTRFCASDRIWLPIIEAHIKAILDERTYTLFRTFDDAWEVSLIDIFINDSLSPDEVLAISRSKAFEILNRAVKSVITPIMEAHDPNFTIWEVMVSEGSDTATVIACGDYRIEQWHKEHHVTKLNVTDSLTMDVYHIFDFIKRTLNYSHAPAYVGRRRTPKDGYYENTISLILTSALKNNSKHTEAVDKALDSLNQLGLINDPLDIHQRIKSYLNYELISKIEQINTGRIITGFVICGQSIIVNFGGRSHFTKDVKTFQELEMESAMANGDYIPERQRR